MPKAVRFDHYGDVDVLEVLDVERPVPGAGQVLVRVKATGINPGEAKIREGLLDARYPATFPSGEGSDLAGIVEELGPEVNGVAAGDEVIGFVNTRSSQAEYAVVDATDLTPKPAGVSWEVAGSLFVTGATAWAAVRAVGAGSGDVLVIAGAAGGVGSLAVQLAVRAGAAVIGLASERHHEWLRGYGVIPVSYGEGVAERIRDFAPTGVDALIDTVGDGYVKLGIDLGIAPDRIDTIADFDAIGEYGVKGDGNAVGGTAAVMAELAGMIDRGELEVTIAATYPLDQVRAAFSELARGHTRGKIVLIP